MRFTSLFTATSALALALGCGDAHEVETGGETNCTTCHGERSSSFSYASDLVKAAPPRGTNGETLDTDRAVGAHQKHLGNGSVFTDGIDCGGCHLVPTEASPLAHVDGKADVPFGSIATLGNADPQYAVSPADSVGSCSSVYCHGAWTFSLASKTSVDWNPPGGPVPAQCGDCHGLPPGTGRHQFAAHAAQTCDNCHNTVAANADPPALRTDATAKALHVNGQRDVAFKSGGTFDSVNKTCKGIACHVDRNW